MAPAPACPPPAAAPAPAAAGWIVQQRGGRTHGSTNHTMKETMCMLTILTDILPIGSYQWDQVVHCHEKNWSTGRDQQTIYRKWSFLYRKAIPTRNPNKTPAIKLAKEMKHLTGVKAACGDGEDEFDLVEGHEISEDDTTLENSWENNTNSPPPLHQPSQLTELSSLKKTKWWSLLNRNPNSDSANSAQPGY